MSRKLSIEEVREKIKKIHGDIVVLDETTYTNAVNTCRFLDKEHGEFWNKLIHVVNRKQGHPARRAQKTKETC